MRARDPSTSQIDQGTPMGAWIGGSGVSRRILGAAARPVRAIARALGYDVVPSALTAATAPRGWPPDFDRRDIDICEMVAPFTMTSPERIYALRRAVQYVASSGIAGAIVECGVWRGGSVMAVARTLMDLDRTDYELYLFDTFSGMPAPGELDRDSAGRGAADLLSQSREDSHVWALSSLEETMEAVYSVGYPRGRIHFIVGPVEETIPSRAPETIALLRLDTDWYESTRHELVHLFPRLVAGGVLILDDYGHWQGARKATDEYLAEQRRRLLLNRIDYTARIGIKLG